MIFRLAFRNIVGNGWRSLINVVIIAVVLIGLIWMESLWYSWLYLAKTQQRQWEFGSGILRVRSYDPFDSFSWDKSYAPIPAAARQEVADGRIVPILFAPGVIYPQGRMMNVMVKGIPEDQKLLKLPSDAFAASDGYYIPALIGKSMAQNSKLNVGDIFTLRVRDSAGAFNAVDLVVARIMDCPVPSLDMGTVWMDLGALRQARQLPEVATVLVLDDARLATGDEGEYRLITDTEFFSDLNKMVQTKASGQSVMFILMIFLAMLAVFDTQALAIFKRRKEIGMLSALGMTKKQVIRLFTLEGAMYMLCAIVATLVLGLPLFWYFSVKGLDLALGGNNFGVAGFSEPLKFIYPLPLIIFTLLLIFAMTAFISWLPARRIARMNTVDALRGR
jgi:ABC-type lipoprotein release transport system permease subunit